jgi:dTDP-4-amino-4,6-dideoxygalactose transaminase
MWKIQLFKLNFDHREPEAVRQVLEGGWLTMGDRIAGFEEAFAGFLGSDSHCTAVANGTAALHLAMLALEIGPGDEVVIPALTFVADANVVALSGARPVLADCGSPDNWNVTADSIAQKISDKTKAVVVVHYAGFPCDMPAIVELCRDRGIHLVEDVAHAPGASVAGRPCGTWGDIACFSFFTNKNLSIGEGGMVATCNPALHQQIRYLRSHGMTTLTLDRHKGRAITYDVVQPGLNYRMDEMRAAIGLVQLEKLPAGNARRKQLFDRYRAAFVGSGILMPFANLPADYHSAYHIAPVLLPVGSNRAAIIESLKSQGIQTSIHYPPFWGFSAYGDRLSQEDAPIVAEIATRELTLPLYPTMTDMDVDFVAASLLSLN